jgi:anti-sigma B factor antagonist
MHIREDIKNNIATLTISGHMMGGPECYGLHDKMKSLLSDGIRKIVIDLRNVKWMNSSGLGTLMSCWGAVCIHQGEMKLANVTDKIQSLLVISRILQFFETYNSVDRAASSFRKMMN